MNDDVDNEPQRPDWAISVILILIWGIGVMVITTVRTDTPKSMLIIGTIFFIVAGDAGKLTFRLPVPVR